MEEKIMKKLLMAVLALSLVLVGCSSNKDKDTSGVITIGIIQQLQHGSLDQSREGFIKAIEDAGYVIGKDVVIDYQNGSGDQATLTNIAQKFVNDKKDLVLAIATDAAISIANATTEIPILVTAVTDLKDAGLVDDYNKPGGNISGTTDMTPVAKQLELLLEIDPSIKTVGLLATNESNSLIQLEIAKEYLDKVGIAYEERIATTSNDIASVTESLASKVDAIYAPTDNTIASAIGTVVQISDPLGIPTVGGSTSMVKDGMSATAGIDYYKLGYQTGEMAVRILKGEDKISEMAIESLEDVDVVFNQTSLDAIGLILSDELANKALEIYK